MQAKSMTLAELRSASARACQERAVIKSTTVQQLEEVARARQSTMETCVVFATVIQSYDYVYF